MSWNSLHKHDEPTISMSQFMWEKHVWQFIVKCVKYISIKTQIFVPYMKSQSDLVFSVKCVERISRHQETLTKKH